MKVILAGAGESGSFIAKYLAEESIDIVVIDIKENIIRNITNNDAISGLVGNAKSLNVLEEADIQDADMLIATTENDDANIIICHLAGIYKVQNKIARLRNIEYLDSNWKELFYLRNFYVDEVISPIYDLMKSINFKIKYSHLDIADLFSLVDDEVKLFSCVCDNNCLVLNKSIEELEQNATEKKIHLKVYGILRNNSFFIPHDDEIIKLNDKIFISTTTNNIELCCSLIYLIEDIRNKVLDRQINNIILCGDSEYIKDLALSLYQNDYKVKVILNSSIEGSTSPIVKELTKCNIPCIDDDITSLDYRNNYLNYNDIVVLFNNEDKTTALNALLLKNQGISNIFCCLNSSTYEQFLLGSNIKQISIPYYFIMSPILLNIRRGVIFNVIPFYNKAEILELEIAEDSIASGQKIQFIEQKSFKIINVFDKDDKPLFISKNLFLQSGYRVVLIANKKYIKEVENNFSQNSNISI